MPKTSFKEPTPVISRTLIDGTLIETIFDAKLTVTQLATRKSDGSILISSFLDLQTGERLAPYAATNNLLTTGCLLLPSAVGDTLPKAELVQAIRTYLHRYVDLSPLFEEIAAYYVLLSWVYDAFNELPYLRFQGDFGTGKTRALMTIGSICYKPFFASGASTVSPIFHILDAIGGTLVLDEADLRFSDATADLTKILNNGNARGLPVLRTMTNRHRELNPQAFRVYGPKLIGMRERFQDPALESRFLTEETGRRTLRTDIPIHQPDSLAVDALQLRNQLLSWRFHARHQTGVDPSRIIAGIEPRRNQTALALLSLVDDDDLRERIRHELVGEEARVLNERASTPAATVLSCLRDAFNSNPSLFVTVADVTRRFNTDMAQELGAHMTPKWVGGVIRNKLRLETMKTRGVYVIPCTERNKIELLAKRFGVKSKQSTSSMS